MDMLMAVVMVLAAVAPAWLLLRHFLRFDQFPEPDEVIWRTFFLGVLAIIPVLVVVLPIQPLAEMIESPFARALSAATIESAIPEEIAKFLILYYYCRRHSAFDEPMDGLVYGATASLGFACFENILFVVGAGDAWIQVALIRGFLAVPSHALSGVIMGFFLSRAHFEPERRGLDLTLALVVPTVLHAGYNFPLFYSDLLGPDHQDGLALLLPLITIAIVVLEVVWAHRLFFRLRRLQREEKEKAAGALSPAAGD
jgi:protease PrsW